MVNSQLERGIRPHTQRKLLSTLSERTPSDSPESNKYKKFVAYDSWSNRIKTTLLRWFQVVKDAVWNFFMKAGGPDMNPKNDFDIPSDEVLDNFKIKVEDTPALDTCLKVHDMASIERMLDRFSALDACLIPPEEMTIDELNEELSDLEEDMSSDFIKTGPGRF